MTATAGSDEPWVRRAVRRRRWRQASVAVVPVIVVGWIGVVLFSAEPFSSTAMVAVAVLAGAVAVGWSRLEPSAGMEPPSRWARHLRTTIRPEELDDARAEYALRHHRPVPTGYLHRVERLARQRVRNGWVGLAVGLGYVGLGVAILLGVARHDHDALDHGLGVVVLVLAAVELVRSGRYLWIGRRWLRTAPTPSEVPS